MKSLAQCIILAVLVPIFAHADYRVLVIGSSQSYADSNEKGATREAAFPPAPIAMELEKLLKKDNRLKGTIQVTVDDIHRQKKVPTAVGQRSNKPWDMTYHAYSLAQYYFWPEGRAERLKNLQGKGANKWDAVVLMADPYMITNMPGIYAEGVNALANDIIAGGAKPVLLMQWPKDDSKINHYVNVITRVGSRKEIVVAPAALAWKQLRSKKSTDAPYVAAATIYSVLGKQSPSRSGYVPNRAIADQVWSAVRKGTPPMKGAFTFQTPFTMKYAQKRQYSMHQTGSSSERGIMNGLKRVASVGKVSFGGKSKGEAKFDFNLGRGNTNFEKNKQYKVNPEAYGRSYGFPMGERRDIDGKKRDGKGAAVSTLYGIDKRFMNGRSYDDGTDLGIAYDMIRQGEVAKDVRCLPIRLLHSKMHAIDDKLTPNRDGWHMSTYADEATASFLYTSLSGRCAIGDEPKKDANDKNAMNKWRLWLGRRIGYETAWRASHLHARVPGFEVLPSAANAKSIRASKTEKLTVRFLYPPKSPVKVNILQDAPNQASLSTTELVFTPTNYNTQQTVTVTGKAAGALRVRFKTASADPVYSAISDTWDYTIE